MTKKILIVRFSALGDIALTTGPIEKLKLQIPNLEIDLLTSPIGEELFVGSTVINQVITLPKKSNLSMIKSVYRSLKAYDAVIDLQGNLKSKILRFFIKSQFYSIEKQSFQRRAFVKNRKYKEQLTQHVTQKYYDTFKKAFPELKDLSQESLRPKLLAKPITINKSKTSPKQKIVVFHPYASQTNKVWPYANELVTELIKKDIKVIVIGSSPQTFIHLESPLLFDFSNRTSLSEMASIIQSGDIFLTTDSGPMHIAIGLGKETRAIFGPTTKEFGFYPQYRGVKVIETDLECRPCHVHGGNQCPLSHHKCMKNISTSQVVNELLSSLNL